MSIVSRNQPRTEPDRSVKHRTHMRTLIPLLAAAMTLAAPHPAAQQRNAAPAEPVRLLRGLVRSTDPFAPPLRRARVVTLEGRGAVFTDTEGRFAIPLAPPTTLRVSKPGYAPRHIRIAPSTPDEIEIQLASGAVIVGDVIDEPGGPGGLGGQLKTGH